MCDCPPCPSSPLSPVLAELQQADLITSEECKGLSYTSDVVRVQRRKSADVIAKTADVLRRHGFDKESKLLEGNRYIQCFNGNHLTLHQVTKHSEALNLNTWVAISVSIMCVHVCMRACMYVCMCILLQLSSAIMEVLLAYTVC